MLTGRRHEGRRNTAQRGALLHHPPLGDVRGSDGEYPLDPDEQARRVIGLMFEVCEHQGSWHGVWRYFVAQDMRWPMRPHRGVHRGQLAWHRPHRMP